jgi:hypothetical protein
VDEMREMRDEAQQLDERQDRIAEEMEQELEARQKTLAGSGTNRELAERIDQQNKSLAELIDRMKKTSEQAEVSEPLLSRKLYDTLRDASTENLDKALQATGELLRRNFLPQAQEIERRAGDGIEEIRQGVEEAARNVLGDDAESLRLAREQLDELIRQANDEAVRAAGGDRRQPGDPNESAGRADQSRRADAQPGAENERPGDQPAGQAQDAAGSERPQRAQQGGSLRNGTQSQDARGDVARADADGRAEAAAEAGQWDDPGARGPFTGEDFRPWSDNLRDIEEMLPERDLREEAARIWDRARTVRAEFKRHGREPQWDLVRSQIIDPLTELRRHVSDRLAQLQSDEAMVPIDRDPVPDRFAEMVRTYFENLGQGDR